MQVNVVEAKRDFSRLMRLLETEKEESIFVARNGKPIIKMTVVEETPVSKRIGVAKGKFKAPDDFDAANDEVCAMLTGGPLALCPLQSPKHPSVHLQPLLHPRLSGQKYHNLPD